MISVAWAIGHKHACLCIFAKCTQCRHVRFERRRYDPRTVRKSQRTRKNQCCVCMLARHSGECTVNVVEDADLDWEGSQARCFSGRRCFLELQFVDGVVGVPEDSHSLGRRNGFLQKLNSLRREINRYECQSGCIAAWMGKTLH